jgi:hypothetical protein
LPDDRFFADPHVDALMGSMLGLTGELLLLSARQRRIEAALGVNRAESPRGDQAAALDPAVPLDPAERAWVAERADALVAAWLDPFRGRTAPDEGTDGPDHAA